MKIIGYKCFNSGMINRYGKQFKVGEIYAINGKIRFGNNGNGFHLCERMEDTLRYFNAMEENVDICLVKGSGKMVTYHDEYYGYYDMHVVEFLEILKLLTREEIIQLGLMLNEICVKRFIAGYRLTQKEINLFKEKYSDNLTVIQTIEYYQENELDAFVKKRGLYGQNNN